MFGISIHAPAQGATEKITGFWSAKAWHFNPRSRTGSDFGSIDRAVAYPNFNPRSRTGSDGENHRLLVGKGLAFQSTLPHRERLWFHRQGGSIPKFQSTLPHRERRNKSSITSGRRRNFNPRSRTGSDKRKNREAREDNHFNPRSRTGSDRICHYPGRRHFDFNPRSRTGSDGTEETVREIARHFNPRSRTGSDGCFAFPRSWRA